MDIYREQIEKVKLEMMRLSDQCERELSILPKGNLTHRVRGDATYYLQGVHQDGKLIRYAFFGSGKKSLIILPGLSVKSVIDSATQIEKAYSVFADDYTVYLFDRNENTGDGYSVEKVASDVRQIMDFLGIKKADFFGASFGGMVAQTIAARYPEAVNRLALGSTGARACDGSFSAIDIWVKLAEEGKKGLLLKQIFAGVYGGEGHGQDVDFFGEGEKISDEELKRFLVYAKCARDFDIYDEIHKIKCKTLVIGAKNDKVIPVSAVYDIAEKLNCEIYVYPDYGHAVFDEAPDYKQRLYDFFTR